MRPFRFAGADGQIGAGCALGLIVFKVLTLGHSFKQSMENVNCLVVSQQDICHRTLCLSEAFLQSSPSLLQPLSSIFLVSVMVKHGVQKEKSLVKQVMLKQDKRDEYRKACAEVNEVLKKATCDVEVLKDVQGAVDYFASVPDDQSNQLITGAVAEMVQIDRVKECMEVLDPKSKKYNSIETKLEGAAKLMMVGQMQKLELLEKKVEDAKKSLILNLMRHCVNVSTKGSKIDATVLRELVRTQHLKLTLASSQTSKDVSMENLTNLFGKTRL